ATDAKRLTGLVILGIRDRDTFPLIFYREDCADMAIGAGDIDPAFIGSAHALLVTGTHFSQAGVAAASRAAMRAARHAGTQVILDIDYRPVLWGLTGHGQGEERFVACGRVSEHLQSIVVDCDLIVGTEEEIHIAGGTDDTLAALRRVRELSGAIIVLKRGPLGCVVFPESIPASLDDGIVGRGFEVEVFNVLGAGDAFMSGFLSGWVAGESLEACSTYANACGALVVSRHGCAPAMPSRRELDHFMARAAEIGDVRTDEQLAHVHRVTTQRREWSNLCIFALDNRLALEAMADEVGTPHDRLKKLKSLLVAGARHAAEEGDIPEPGVIIDDRWGEEALYEMARSGNGGFWVARAVERSGLTPLTFEHEPNVGLNLRTWPREHVVKCLMRFLPDDEEALQNEQLLRLERLYRACLTTGHELLLEILPHEGHTLEGTALVGVMRQVYDRGIKPDWWKLQPQRDADAWKSFESLLGDRDPFCRGILLLGGGTSLDELGDRFQVACRSSVCCGFAVGRTIFAEPSRAWLAGELEDRDVVSQVAERFLSVVDVWRQRCDG
ncbi:MAG: PfkB family carbohydrate kinase, partial [Myxococcota bacterium]